MHTNAQKEVIIAVRDTLAIVSLSSVILGNLKIASKVLSDKDNY
jgi:hypothetical protein